MDNFVGIFDDIYTKEECQKIIDYFEMRKQCGLTYNRQEANDMEAHQKSDESLILTDTLDINPGCEVMSMYTNKFWNKVFEPYVEKYSILKFIGQVGIITVKIQKTLPSQGYHVWHFENDDIKRSGRVLTFMTYLNNVEEAGETEFLYTPKRVKPIAGRTLLWPSGFTHTHRGNPPISGEKYIITGWIEWCGKN
jgi:hypothetical protein